MPKTNGKCPTTRKAPISAGLLLSEKLSECGRRKQRSPTMKKPRQHSMKNRERLRKERLVREATEGPMLAPTPELPDDTPIERVLFSTRIQNVLRAADLKTVGEVREISDETLISLPDFGKGSLSDLRKKLGLPSTDGVRPSGKDPA
jgi:DNA-directed RNA polymerase alpha subunit